MRRCLIVLLVVVAGLFGTPPAQAATTGSTPVSRTGSVVSGLSVDLTTQAPVAMLGLVETEIHWTRWSRWVVHGQDSVLEGQVVTEDGALPDADVDLYARPAGADTWSQVATTSTSDVDGIFRFRHRPSRNTAYRVVHEGALLYARSEASRQVSVRRRVSDSMWRTTDGRFALAGGVSPGYVGRRVVLQRKKCRGCSWSTVADAHTSTKSRWRFTVSGPSSPGTWYYRAMVPGDSRFVTSYGDHVWSVKRG